MPEPDDLVETWDSFNKAGLKAEAAIKDDPDKNDDWGDMSVLDVPSLDSSRSSRSQLVWADQLEEGEFDDKSWAPTALLHRSKLEAWHDAVAGVGVSVPRVVSKIDGDIRRNFKSARAEIGSLKKDRMELESMLGDLMGVVAAHGDLAGTVSHLLTKTVDHDGKMAVLDSELFKLSTSVEKADNKLDSLTGKLLSVITKVQRSCNTKISLIEDRMKALEGARLRVDTSASPRAAAISPHVQPCNDEIIAAMLAGADPRLLGGNNFGTGAATGAPTQSSNSSDNSGRPSPVAKVDGNTVFGQASLGGTQVDLTVNTVCETRGH